VHGVATTNVHELELLVDDGADAVEIVRAESVEHLAEVRRGDGLRHAAILDRNGGHSLIER